MECTNNGQVGGGGDDGDDDADADDDGADANSDAHADDNAHAYSPLPSLSLPGHMRRWGRHV